MELRTPTRFSPWFCAFSSESCRLCSSSLALAEPGGRGGSGSRGSGIQGLRAQGLWTSAFRTVPDFSMSGCVGRRCHGQSYRIIQHERKSHISEFAMRSPRFLLLDAAHEVCNGCTIGCGMRWLLHLRVSTGNHCICSSPPHQTLVACGDMSEISSIGYSMQSEEALGFPYCVLQRGDMKHLRSVEEGVQA